MVTRAFYLLLSYSSTGTLVQLFSHSFDLSSHGAKPRLVDYPMAQRMANEELPSTFRCGLGLYRGGVA